MKNFFSLIILAVICFASYSTMEAAKNFTAKDLMSLKRISDGQVSPDGKWVLYNLKTPAVSENKFYTDIYAVKIDGSETLQITTDKAADFNGRWSPDGKKIAFLSTRNGAPQIFVKDFPNGTAKQITKIEAGVSNMDWSPKGNFFSFTSEVKLDKTPQEKYPEYNKAEVRIYDDLPVRHWSEWTDESYSHLFVIPSNGGTAKDLNKDMRHDTPLKPFDGGEDISWSPDESELCYTMKIVPQFEISTDSQLYTISREGGEAKNITPNMPGYDKAPLYSPDGKWIAFHSQERAGFESDRIRLMLYNRESGKITELSKTLDQWVGTTIWAPDSKSLYFDCPTQGTKRIYNITLDGEWKILTEGWFNYGATLSITPDGKTLVFGRESMQEPNDLVTMPAGGGDVKQITDVNKKMMAQFNKIKIEEKWFTAKDGKKIHTWIVYPPNFDPNKKYPMITYLQGGPQSMLSQQFHYRWNWYLMASHGYIINVANRRGVPGFGQDWNDAISKDWGGMPMQDYLTVTDEMNKLPYVDKNKVAAIGASAGGYAAYWMAGNHEGRFKALLAHCGVFNLESMYGATEEIFFPNWENGGPYWDKNYKEFYDKNSPHRFAQNWDTPIIISTGEYDFRVPYTQSLEAFTVAQLKGIPSKLLVYPQETHFIAKPQEYIIWDAEVYKFLDRFCK